MRQVPHDAGSPAHHLLIGNGRLARHLAHYFKLEGLPYTAWNRPREITEAFFDVLDRASPAITHVWILVSDSAISSVAEPILNHYRALGVNGPHLLHASGARIVPGLRSVHPVMTFGQEFYELGAYRRIPFVLEAQYDGETEISILGGLTNPAVFLPPEKRALYHAFVSASGNFPSLLWAEIFERFENDLGLPREILAPFLFQSLTNVVRSGDQAITGPLIRGDQATIRAHQTALGSSPLGELYLAFIKFFNSTRTAARPEMKESL